MTRAPWVAFGATLALTVVASALPDNDWPLAAIVPAGVALLITAACGAVIASRRRGNPIGWILLGTGLSVSSLFCATQYANRALVDRPGSLPGGTVAAWLQAWVAVPVLALVALLFLLFPTGHLLTRRWRFASWTVAAGCAVAVLGVMLRPGPFDTFPAVQNPVGIGAAGFLRPLFEAAQITTLVGVLASAGSVVLRYRRSRGTEREQLKWFAYAVVTSVVLFLLNPLVSIALGFEEPPLALGFVLPFLGSIVLPISIALAILRRGLYDIDRIISRTVSYAIVTLFLGATFVVLALGPVVVVGSGGSAPDYLIAAATLVVAALFRPARRRVQGFVDRRFNRSRYDAAQTIEAFAARLRQDIDLDSLGAELRALVAGTMHPSHVSLWIRPPVRAQDRNG